MSRIAMDSISFAALAGKHWPHLIGYFNGRISAWSPGEIAQARRNDQLLGLVDVLGTAPRSASILDFERGDVQSPAVVGRWVEARNEVADDAVVYVQPAKIHTIVQAVGKQRVGLWVVDLTPDGELAFDVPDYGPLPANVRIVGRQCVFGPRSGGNFDLSVIYDDSWHPEQQAPAHYTIARAAAAAELGRYAAAVLPDVDTAAAAAVTAVDPAADHAAAEAAATARQLGPLGQAAAAVDRSATELAGAALIASTAPEVPAVRPVAVLGPDGRDSGRTVFERVQVTDPPAGSTPAPEEPGAGPAAAGNDSTAAAAVPPGPAQSSLNHDFIRHTLADAKTVANMLHSDGWHHAAGELERVLGIVWELGGALQKAGL